MLGVALVTLAAAAADGALMDREEVLIDLDPGGLVWSGLDVDDDLALLLAIALNASSPAPISLVAVTVCGGNAPIKHTAPALDRLLRIAGVAMSIPRGHGWQTMTVGWPSLRRLNRLSPDWPSSQDAASTIARAARASSAGLTVISLGPPSNLAAALSAFPDIIHRLRRVVLMGGELTGGKLDLNFVSDRGAARTVLQSAVPTMIVPIQTCAQAAFTLDAVRRLEAQCCPGAAVCALLPKMALQARVMPGLVNTYVAPKLPSELRWRPSVALSRGFIPWDVVALLAALRPHLFGEWEAHAVELPTCDGPEPCDSTMVVEREALPASLLATAEVVTRAEAVAARASGAHRNVATVPHLLRSEAAFLDETIRLVCAAPAAVSLRRPIHLGFVREVALLAGASLVALVALPLPGPVLRPALLGVAALRGAHIARKNLKREWQLNALLSAAENASADVSR